MSANLHLRATTLALLTSVVAAYAWTTHQSRYSPDFELYTQGGVGLWPSIPGRMLGSLGPNAFAAISIVSAGIIVYMIARKSIWGGFLFALGVGGYILGFAGIDPIALAIFAIGLSGYRPLLMIATSAIMHLALIPYAIYVLYQARPSKLVAGTLAFFVGIPVILALAFTPYSHVLYQLLDPRFFSYFVYGTCVGLLFALPLLLCVRIDFQTLTPFLIAGLLCGAQNHFQVRYLLPALLLTAWQAQRPLQYHLYRQRGVPA